MEKNHALVTVLPVVIVGKDRTRMTCEVIRNIHKQLTGSCNLYFILVSDRSHERHLPEIRMFCERELGIAIYALETPANRYGWGSAMNIGLEEAYKIAPYALVLDNDWILNRQIPELGKLCEILSSDEGDIGAITLKCPNEGRNLDYWEAEYKGVDFLFSHEKEGAPYAYPVEIGCQLISKRFHEKMQFLECENKTDNIEGHWIGRYRELQKEGFGLRQVNLASEKGTELNKPGCLFYHIGKHTQSGRERGMKIWPVPKEYEYLNEENETDKKKRKILFATNGDFLDATSPLRASLDILKDVADGEFYVVGKSLFGKEAFLNIFEYAIQNGYSHIIYSDADNFIVSKKNLMTAFDRFVKSGKTFAGCPDGGMFCHRNHNPNAINPFLMFVSVDGLRKYLKDGKLVFKGDWSHRETGWESVIEDYGKWRERTGFTNPFAKKIAGVLDDPDEARNYGSSQVCWTYKEKGGRFEPYYDIFLNLEDGDEIFYLNGGDWVGRGDESGLTSAIYCFEGEHDYSDERNVICLHSWFSRFCFEPKGEFEKKHRERITRLAKVARDWYGLDTIDWEKYFDGIYCLHYFPQSDKYEFIKNELRRVGILDSGIFEFKYTFPSPYDEIIFNAQKDNLFCPKPLYVNCCLGIRQILNEAIAFGRKRILILENDIAFLKDTGELKSMLEKMPADATLVQFDKYICEGHPLEIWNRICSEQDGDFVDIGNENFTSAGGIVLNEDGMRAMLREMDKRISATDQLYRFLPGKKYIARKNICIQVLHANSNCYSSCGLEAMHMVYRTININYSEYSVPESYGYGSYVLNGEVINPVKEEDVTGNVIGDRCKGRKKVSVYAIARNESKNVEKWYRSMSEADEVCVLDTGSTDDTVEKLRKLGAKVTVEKFDKWNSVEEYDELVRNGGNPWRFDKARNDSMDLVADDSEILVTTDIDEFIQPGWRKKLEDAWIAAEKAGKHPNCAGYKYIWWHSPDWKEQRSFEVHKISKKGSCRWTHMIHEILSYKEGDRPVWIPDLIVEHNQDMTKSRKSYLPMLAVEARDMPDNDRSAHYYGRELMYEKKWDEAIRELKRHLSLPSAGWRAERAASMRYIANCYAYKGDTEMQELWLWKCAQEDPNHREAAYALGELYMNRKDYRAACRAYEKCLSVKTRSREYISNETEWSGRPNFLYAQCLWWTGDWASAEGETMKALAMEPDNAEYRKQLDGMRATRKKYGR